VPLVSSGRGIASPPLASLPLSILNQAARLLKASRKILLEITPP
jgi:hypothetical protein